MTDLVVNRRALEKARNAASCQELAAVLGFDCQAHPVNFLADSTSTIHARVSSVASSLYRIGAFSTPTGNVAFWAADLHEDGQTQINRARARRRIVKALVDLEPSGDRRVLIALFADGGSDVELVLPRIRTDQSLGTVRATVDRLNPTHHHLELLSDLAVHTGMASADIARRFNDAFNVDKVAKKFYIEFKNLRNRVLEEVYQANPNNKIIHDPANKDEVRRYVTRNLGRVLFLWFLQSKGWLDNDRSFFVNLYERRCRTDSTHNFFRDTLVPLFFEALAKKKGWRSDVARTLGDVPFLNGGLFLQNWFEDELYGDEREHLAVVLSNVLFDPRQHSPESPTVLGLLRSYRFTTRESTPDDQSVDPDPELLGKVFENMNEEAERAESGTFYTPREVVHFMCRETLDGYVMRRTNCHRATLDWLRAEALDPENDDRHLSKREREAIEKALDEVTVCDPAVGSGAFPVGMMHEILLLKRGLEQSADVTVDIGGQRVAEWKEHIITNCLYGVDVNPEAVEICHLRLWLSLVIDANEPLPLPNLDFRFVAGDSLVDRIGTDRLLESLPRICAPTTGPILDDPVQERLSLGKATLPAPVMQQKLGFGRLGELPTIEAEIRSLRDEFATADMPSKARTLRDRIKKKQVKAVRIQVDTEIAQARSSLKQLEKRNAELEKYGASPRDLKAQRRVAEVLKNRISLLENIVEGVDDRAASKKPLFWPIEFPEVFDRGGFDIVVANPPYVRQESLSADDQEAYKSAFPETFVGTADLYVYFFQRAYQILKDRGRLAFITSNSFTKRSYGKKLMAFLAGKLSILRAIDFGELKVFDATVEPYVLVAKKETPAEDHALEGHQIYCAVSNRIESNRGNVAAVREVLDDIDGVLREDLCCIKQMRFHEVGWRLEDDEILDVYERMMKKGTTLGEFVQGRLYRGILTGLNEAFVIDKDKRDELVKADPASADIIKPWLSGREIRRWGIDWTGDFAIVIQSSGDADANNPWATSPSESAAASIFKSKYPAIFKHLSGFKAKLRERTDKGRFWWELRSCTYYNDFESEKAVWMETNRYFGWALVGPEYYLNKTTFFIPNAPAWLLAILSSKWSWFAIAFQQATGIGGFLNMQKDFVQDLRVPDLREDDKRALDNLMQPILSEKALSLKEYWRHDIHDSVANLMGLSADDQVKIENWFYRRSIIDPRVAEETTDE